MEKRMWDVWRDNKSAIEGNSLRPADGDRVVQIERPKRSLIDESKFRQSYLESSIIDLARESNVGERRYKYILYRTVVGQMFHSFMLCCIYY